MADDRILRIILEGRDKLSGVVRAATRSINNDLDKIQEKFRGVGAESDDLDSTMQRSFRRIEKGTESIRKVRKEYESLGSTIKKVKRGLSETDVPLFGGGTATRGPDGRFAKSDAKQDEEAAARRRAIINAIGAGVKLSKTFQENLDKELAATKELFDLRSKELTEEREQKLADLRTDQNKQRAADAEIQEMRRKDMHESIDFLYSEIDAIKQSHEGLTKAQVAASIREYRRKIAQLRAEHRLENELRKAATTEEFQQRRLNLNREYRQKRADLKNINREEITAAALARRNEELDRGGGLERAAKKAGVAFGDFASGVRQGRDRLRGFITQADATQRPLLALGFAVGRVTKEFNRYVNLRWTFITGIFVSLISVATQLAGVLVSLASSAGLAAAALGAAFGAGLVQALPAVGLLAGAFQRVNTVLDALKIAEDNRLRASRDAENAADRQRQLTQRLEDAHWRLKTALEGVGDAQYNLAQAQEGVRDAFEEQLKAIRDLAEARKEAQQDIIDANLEEKDSALALEEAELALLQAKQRLREEEERKRRGNVDIRDAQAAVKEAEQRLKIVQQQGDQAEIAQANQSLSIARQNLSAIQDQAAEAQDTIKDAELGVRRAEINRQQAAIRAKRSSEEAETARKKGIEGSEKVLQAEERLQNATESIADAQRNVVLSNREVSDALHAVAIARREEADAKKEASDATNTQTEAQKRLQEALADLSPSEKRLFNSLKRIKELYRKTFVGTSEKDGIFGPINDAFARIVDKIASIITDPTILKNLKVLAGEIGKSLDAVGDFVISPEFKEFLNFFIKEAAKNLPNITKAFLNLLRAFLRISKAGAPLFADLLKRFTGFTEQIEKLTRDEKKLDKFFGKAREHLDAWINFGKAVGNVILALFPSAAPSGKTFLEDVTDGLNNLAEFLRNNPEGVSEFFEKMRENLTALGKVAGRVIPILFSALTSEGFQNLNRIVLEVLVPGLFTFFEVLGLVATAITALLDLPVIGDLVKWALTILIVEKSFNKLFPITQVLTNLIKKGLIVSLVGMFKLFKDPQKTVSALRDSLTLLRYRLGYAKDAAIRAAKSWKDATLRAIELQKAAFRAAKQGLLTMASAARTAAVAAGTRLVSALKTLVIFIRGALVRALLFLRFNIRLLLLSTGIGALILAGILLIENWDKVKAAARKLGDLLLRVFKGVVKWVKDNWKTVGLILLSIFLPGAALVIGIIKFKGTILKVFGQIKDGIINAIKFAANWVQERIGKLGGFIQSKLEKLPVIGRFFKKNALSDEEVTKVAPKILSDKFFENKKKRIKSLKEKGLTPDQILKELVESGELSQEDLIDLFAKYAVKKRDGGEIGGGGKTIKGYGSDTVPAMLTPGEWVLNKTQQTKLAKRLGMTTKEISAWLFGTNLGKTKPSKTTTGTKPAPNKTPFQGPGFNLHPHVDEDSNEVWFIEFADGTWGQVTGRDATKIMASQGRYIPNYVKRNAHGFNQIREATRRAILNPNLGFGFAGGGIVPQKFNSGGIVQAPGFGNTQSTNKTLQQNFNVTTQGETDWNYVMRLGAIHAQSSY